MKEEDKLDQVEPILSIHAEIETREELRDAPLDGAVVLINLSLEDDEETETEEDDEEDDILEDFEEDDDEDFDDEDD